MMNQLVNPANESLLAFEIAQQPVVWPTTLERIQSTPLPKELRRLPVVLTGAGTSAYAASAIANAWPDAKAIPTTDLLLQSSADIERAVPSFATGGVLISLARSGDSPESVGTVERIKSIFPSVQHLAIVCNEHGRLANLPGVQVICLDTRTNDLSLAMTGSFSNLVLAGLCLIHHEEIAEHLPAICNRASEHFSEMNAVAEDIAGACGDRIAVLTSSMHALAQETSIKALELTAGRVTVLTETFLGLRHGPLSFLREDTPILCFASSSAEKRRYEEDVLEYLRDSGIGRLAVIGDGASSKWQRDWFVPAVAPNLADYLRTPFEVLFSQLIAYHLSRAVGIDPDNPSPNGLVTRVVKTFKLH
ncbi:MAG: hypothetical protein ABI147_11175 [Acidobacteriaceae bacterium]